jgi:hypothetical protein
MGAVIAMLAGMVLTVLAGFVLGCVVAFGILVVLFVIGLSS